MGAVVIRWIRSLTPTGVWILAGLLGVLILGAVLLWNAWGAASTAKTETKLVTGQADAALKSGADAARTVGKTAGAEAATDSITRENERAIRNAPGADAPVDPALHGAGLRGLCRYAAYRGKPECVQQPAP